ncbi:hypothetical protein M5689_010021 [Euphorbia peplus]|nr:hypothetical protein M5689_010021 [Euphorbia peplus]
MESSRSLCPEMIGVGVLIAFQDNSVARLALKGKLAFLSADKHFNCERMKEVWLDVQLRCQVPSNVNRRQIIGTKLLAGVIESLG